MADNQQNQRKQFTVPSRDELIQQIKQLDQDIEHVTLNLIKCDFNATEKDVEKAFPDINFVKVKNYNPGSFEVVFEMKIDAINFIRNHYDKKILNRRFFIKMGRQQKQLVEEWTGVGYVPKTFKGPHKPQHGQNKPGQHKPRKTEGHQKEEKHEQPKQIKDVIIQQKQIKEQIKQNEQHQEEVAEKKQGKHIPKKEFHSKKEGYHKKIAVTSQNQVPGKVIIQNRQNKKQTSTPGTTANQRGQQTNSKKQQPPQNVTNSKTTTKKQEKKQKQQPTQQPTKETETKEEDDGWIVVGKKPTNKRR